MLEVDMFTAAKLLIDMHDKDAAAHAIGRAHGLEESGDHDGAKAWRAITVKAKPRVGNSRISVAVA